MAADRGLGVGIGGFGAIGMDVGRTLDAGDIPGMYLAAVSANDQSGAAARMADYAKQAPVMELSALADHSDVVIECAPAAVFPRRRGSRRRKGTHLYAPVLWPNA